MRSDGSSLFGRTGLQDNKETYKNSNLEILRENTHTQSQYWMQCLNLEISTVVLQVVFWELQLHFCLCLSLPHPPRVRPCVLCGQWARRSRFVINWVCSTRSRTQTDRRTATARRTATTPLSQVHKHKEQHAPATAALPSRSYWKSWCLFASLLSDVGVCACCLFTPKSIL